MTRFAALLLACLAMPANAAISISLAVNSDGTYDTNYPAGNKPDGPLCVTWACLQIGTAAGTIDEISVTSLDLASSGPNDLDDIGIAYKSFSQGDVQVCATVPDQADWTGYTENFTDFGVSIQDGVVAGSFFFRVFLPFVDDFPRRKQGTASANSSQQGIAADGAITLCATHVEDTDTFQGWQSEDGISFTAIGDPVTHAAGPLVAGVWGTSQEAGQTSFATLTGVTATSVVSIFTPADPPEFTAGPSAGTPTVSAIPVTFTVDQTGSVFGVACDNGQSDPTAAEIKAGQCADGAAADAFTQPVVATVSDSDSFTALAENTTYDLHFLAVSTTNGDATSITSVANITTLDDPDPPGSSSCTLSPLASPTNGTIDSGPHITANINCRPGDDIVLGWDFSTPPNTPIAPDGGLFVGTESNNLSNNAIKGNRLYHCKFQWDEIEPVNDNSDPSSIRLAGYNFASVNQCLQAAAATGHEGVIFHVRHTVVKIEDCTAAGAPTTTAKHLTEWTAPSWAVNLAAGSTEDEGCHPQDFHITNLNLDNTAVRAEVLEFIRAFAAQGFLTGDNRWQVMHMKSSSRGEECCGGTSGATMDLIINEWVSGVGANAHKLAWIKEDPAAQWTTAVTEGGTGVRGGIIENAFRSQYTPGPTALSGQSLTAQGHLVTDLNFPPIRDLRHFMDENEFHTLTARNYFISNMRSMQMRRMALWIPNGSPFNVRMDDWMSTQMGQSAASQPEGWVWLMETRAGTATNLKTINNLERGIKQREALGATLSTNKFEHTSELTGNANFPVTNADCDFAEPGGGTGNDCQSAAWSRRENNASNIIGFALEDAWWPTSLTRDAVVKVVYYDSGSATVSVRNSSGTVLDSFATGTTGTIRTATMFIDDFTAPASGDSKDFDLHFTSPVDIIAVRIIKNGGSCGSRTCATW